MDFGLNLILTFVDNATSNLKKVASSIQGVTDDVKGVGKTLQSIEGTASLYSLAQSSRELGSSMVSMGKTVGGVLTNIVNKVISTGSQFESFGITLEQLYGSAEKANEQIDKLLNFSATTPFEIEDVKDLVVVLKSQGLEAFDEINGVIGDTKQQTLSWLGDLMAFKPDIPASRWRLAFTNYLGSGAPKVLQNLLDMGSIEDTIGHAIGGTAEERLNSLVEFIEKKDIGGLMNKMFGTWQQTISNLDDTFTMLYRNIGRTGAFDNFKAALNNLAGSLAKLDEEGKLEKLAIVIGDALDPLAKFAIKVTAVLQGLIISLVDFADEHPRLMRMLTVLTALFSAILVGGGAALLVLSKFAFALITLKDLGSLGGMLGNLGYNFKTLGVIIGLSYFIWKTNLFGIRDLVTDFVTGLSTSFNDAQEAVGKSTEEMMKYFNELDKSTFFGSLTADIMKVTVFIQALSDAWNDGEMSYELYEKAVSLGVIDLVSRVLDLKYRVEEFVKGFKKGWKEANDAVVAFVEGAMKKLEGTWMGNVLDTIIKGITKLMSAITSADLEKWESFGETLGKVAPFVVALAGAFLLFKKFKNNPIAKLLGGSKEAKEAGDAMNGLSQSTSSFAKNAVGLGVAAAGLWLLADASIRLADAGPTAQLAMISMLGTLAAFMVVASKLGKQLDEAGIGLLALGGMFVLVGSGMMLMAGAAKILSDSGTGAIVVFGVMMVGLIALTAVVGYFGAAITAATPGLLAIALVIASVGVAALGVGAAFLMAGAGITMVAGVLPQIAEYGGQAAVAFTQLGVSLGAFGLGIAAAGVAALAAVPGFAALAIPMAAVAIEGKSLAKSFNKMSESIKITVAGMQIIIAGMKALVEAPKAAVNSFRIMSSGIESEMARAVLAVQTAVLQMRAAMNFQWKLPHLKVPHVTVTGAFSIDPPTAPNFKVDWYGKGGVFDKPTVVGVGEQGREAVVPLENNTQWIGSVASAMSKSLSNNGSVNSLQSVPNIPSSSNSGSITPKIATGVTNSTPVSSDTKVDNSVVFNSGAIQIVMNATGDTDIKALAQKIMAEIARQKQINDSMNYGINFAAAGGM